MTSQTYLILIRDARLALAVGTALEDRLLADGHRALALVPAARRPELAGPGYRKQFGTWQTGPGHTSRAPQVVALYEDGLLTRLESLGLAAYVGVPPHEQWRVVHWGNGAGAILLPVATARGLVEAVADHTPWPQYAARVPKAASLRRREFRWAGSGGPSALPRKIAIAGVAGPLVLAGLPAAAAAASGAAQAPVHTGGRSSAPAAAAGTAFQASPAGAGQQVELDNAQANVAMANQITSTPTGAWPSWPTPATDGERDFVYGTTAGLVNGGPDGDAPGALTSLQHILPGAFFGAYERGEIGLIPARLLQPSSKASTHTPTGRPRHRAPAHRPPAHRAPAPRPPAPRPPAPLPPPPRPPAPAAPLPRAPLPPAPAPQRGGQQGGQQGGGQQGGGQQGGGQQSSNNDSMSSSGLGTSSRGGSTSSSGLGTSSGGGTYSSGGTSSSGGMSLSGG
jgi:hypothetical protein